MDTFSEVFKKLPDGWLTDEEALALWNNAFGNILEVGSYLGRSTVLLAHKGNVTALDPFEPDPTTPEVTKETMAQFHKNIEGLPVTHLPIKVEDWEPTKMDFVFLDGDHTEQGTLTQIKKAVACNPKMIAIHDYANGGVGVKKACDGYFGHGPNILAGGLAIYVL